MNMDVIMLKTLIHMIIMTQKGESLRIVNWQGFNLGKFYQSDRHKSRLGKSLTDKIVNLL
jgi:hypothetical protein